MPRPLTDAVREAVAMEDVIQAARVLCRLPRGLPGYFAARVLARVYLDWRADLHDGGDRVRRLAAGVTRRRKQPGACHAR